MPIMRAQDFQINPRLKDLFYKQSIDTVMDVDTDDFWGWSGFSGSCVGCMFPALPVHSPAYNHAPKQCWLYHCAPYHLQQAASDWLLGSGKESNCGCMTSKQKWHFYFSMCMPCTAGKHRENCGDNSVGVCGEPLSLFPTAVHIRTSNTVAHSFNVGDSFSLECSRAEVPLVEELLEYEAEAL